MSEVLARINELANERFGIWLEMGRRIHNGTTAAELTPLRERVWQIDGMLAQLWEVRRRE